MDSARDAAKVLSTFHPEKNKEEFDQYLLMADIRVQYLEYENIEEEVNDPGFTGDKKAGIISRLKNLMANADQLDKRFIALNRSFYYESELQEENGLRNLKASSLYERLVKR